MNTTLVTGAKGCIGAWTIHALLSEQSKIVGLDLPGKPHRLKLILGDKLEQVTLIDGDILDLNRLIRIMEEYKVSRVIHLAALQVPASRAKPMLGAQVNVVGTVNVFEATRATGITHVVYASSVAAYSPKLTLEPETLYGVWKLANEGTARVYHREYGISSIGLRPSVVYGLGRDLGVTSAPTLAMLAAAAGKNYHIPFNTTMVYHTGRDIGKLFAQAASVTDFDQAATFDPPGILATTQDIIEAIHAVMPEVKITYEDTSLPFACPQTSEDIQEAIGPFAIVSLNQGVRDTIRGFRRALDRGLISVEY